MTAPVNELLIDEASVRTALRVMNLKQVEALAKDQADDESLQRALELRELVLEDAA